MRGVHIKRDVSKDRQQNEMSLTWCERNITVCWSNVTEVSSALWDHVRQQTLQVVEQEAKLRPNSWLSAETLQGQPKAVLQWTQEHRSTNTDQPTKFWDLYRWEDASIYTVLQYERWKPDLKFYIYTCLCGWCKRVEVAQWLDFDRHSTDLPVAQYKLRNWVRTLSL